MSENERAILEATLSLVTRYGMSKTNVGDIAKEAGLSRQTVYNQFENKTEIFRAAIRYFTAEARARIDARLKQASDLSDQIDIFIEEFTIKGFKLSQKSPEAHDLVNGAHAFASDIFDESYQANVEIIVGVLRPYEKALKGNGFDVETLADQFQNACRGYKRDAKSLEHLKQLLATQKKFVLMAVS